MSTESRGGRTPRCFGLLALKRDQWIKTLLRAALACAGLAYCSPNLFAGENASGTVHLSWDGKGDAPLIGTPPVTPFPIYIVLEKAPDIRSLGVTLKWFPYDPSFKAGYDVLPTAIDPACGWSSGVKPTKSLQGDTTYTSTIVFPPTSDKSCITYYFQGPPCDSFPPAKFQIEQLIVEDSKGAFDTLHVTGSAKLAGGPGCLADPKSIEPRAEAEGAELSFWATPNPVHGTLAELRLALPAPEFVDIGVFDVRGRLVMPIVRGELPAGQRSYFWDLKDRQGRGVTTGVYFARLRGVAGRRTVPILVAR